MLISGDDASLLAEAMKEGKVNVPVIKVIIVGTAGVGKTCVCHLLLGLPPPDPDERTSTECAKRSVRVIQIIGEEEGEKWEEADLKQMVAEAVPILCKRLRRHAQQMKKDTKGEGVEGETGTKEARSKAKETQVLKPKKGALEIAIEEIATELDQLVREYQAKGQPIPDTQQLPLEKQAIYLTDSGGQQAFWDLAPIFMNGCSTIMFVHRLCDKLEEKPLNDLYEEGKIVGCSQRATLTTAEVFKLMCQRLESGGKSKVIVIGTHKDIYEEQHDNNSRWCLCCKPKDSDDNGETIIDDKNTVFERCIPENSRVYFNKGTKKVIFEVNTAKPKKREEDIARELRKEVVKSAQQSKPIPIAWYVLQIVFEEVAKRLERHVFSVRECETVASKLSKLSFGPDEMKAALRFFDSLNIFFYKEDILPDVVFISSQVPLSCVTELVRKRYQLLEAKENPSEVCQPTDGMWLQFRDQARIKLEHLEDEIFQPHYVPGIFTEEEFLHMLKKLLIVVPINKPSEDLCFCPSLLEMVEVDRLLKKKDIVARVIHFPGGYAPPGVFCCTVCHLQSKPGWKIREQDVVARNQVTFAVKGSRVTVIDKFQFFAAVIERGDADQDFCTDINSALYEAIEHALETTHKKETLFGLSFLCPCTKHEAIHPATADDKFRLICTKEDLKSGTLDDQQKVWQNLTYSGMYNVNKL